MNNQTIHTFGDLIYQGFLISELADLVEHDGVYRKDFTDRWKFIDIDDNANIQHALTALSEYNLISKYSLNENELSDYWKNPLTQPIEFWGIKKTTKPLETHLNVDLQRAYELKRYLDKKKRLSTRVKTWRDLSSINKELFPPKADKTEEQRNTVKAAMRRVKKQYEEIFNEELSFNEDQ